MSKAIKKPEVEILVSLSKKMEPFKWNQLRLFFHILGIGDSPEIEDMKHLVTSKRFLSQKFHESEAVPILHHMLECIEVEGLDQLLDPDLSFSVGRSLAYPSVLVYICKNLPTKSYDNLKSIVSSILGISTGNIASREDMMLQLHQNDEISPGNVEFLIGWLRKIGLEIVAQRVSDYQSTASTNKSASESGSQESQRQGHGPGSQESQPQGHGPGSQESQPQGHGPEPTSAMSGKIRLIAKKIQVSEGDLNRRVLESDLEPIADLIPKHWEQFVGLSADKKDSLSALCEWYRCKAGDATYRVLIEDFISKEEMTIANQVCKMAKVVRFQCTPSQHEYIANTVAIPARASQGVVPQENLWDPSTVEELKVFFMNAEVLRVSTRRWQCGKNGLEQINTGNILEWATRGWKSDLYTSYPRISSTAALKIEESHIRVWFADRPTVGNVCWSYIGKEANKHPGEKTMFLDLFNLHQQVQQSLVIHEFGHALGMEHEHQRSDFWDVLRGLLKDKDNLPGAVDAHRASDTPCGNHPYDPDSIMHYWFDKSWLKDEYQVDDLSKVESIPGLSPKQKEVIRGVHIRDYRNGRLAKEPSEGDFKALNAEYLNII